MFVNLSDIIKKSLIIKGGYKLMSDLINNIIPKPDKELTREHLKKTIEDGCGTDVTIKEANEFYLKTKKKSPKTHSVGARIPSYIYYLLKPRAGAEFDFPISDIIISSLIYFLKLSDEDKLKFMHDNSMEGTKVKQLSDIEKGFNYFLEEFLLENYFLPEVIKELSVEARIKSAVNILRNKKSK